MHRSPLGTRPCSFPMISSNLLSSIHLIAMQLLFSLNVSWVYTRLKNLQIGRVLPDYWRCNLTIEQITTAWMVVNTLLATPSLRIKLNVPIVKYLIKWSYLSINSVSLSKTKGIFLKLTYFSVSEYYVLFFALYKFQTRGFKHKSFFFRILWHFLKSFSCNTLSDIFHLILDNHFIKCFVWSRNSFPVFVHPSISQLNKVSPKLNFYWRLGSGCWSCLQ